MKTFLLLFIVFSAVSAQFPSGFANFGNTAGKLASNIQTGVGGIASRLTTVPIVANVQSFAEFAAQTGKTYASAAEKKLREGLFTARKTLVDTNNAAFSAGLITYESAVNAFSDLTKTEFLNRLTGNKKSTKGEERAKKHRKISKTAVEGNIPRSFDWRQKGGVTPVKFQSECGSCWSFAVTGAIEGHIFRKTGQLRNLSEQNLIDCGKEEFGLLGCDGGYQEYGFEFVTSQKGIAIGDNYPYIGKKNECYYRQSLKGVDINGFATIPSNDENAMMEVVANLGPLACSVNALESLLLYKKGIYSDDECNKEEVNHAILVVGYGTENNLDFWIVKNSWDKVWGEEGYFRLPRGKNFCGIATECSYPLV